MLCIISNSILIDSWDRKYPKAGAFVSGLSVVDDIPNTSSISSSFENWTELKGIREVPMSDFTFENFFYAANDFRRSREIAEQIKQSRSIKPLIIAIDDEGPYILEGAHRCLALHYLGIQSFPALVVIDETEWYNDSDQINA